MTQNSPSQILEQVDRFYSSAFGQLVLLVVCIVTAVGIVIPLIIALFQKSTITAAVQTLSDQFDQKINSLKSTIPDAVSKEVSAKFENERAALEALMGTLSQKFKADLAAQELLTKKKLFSVEAKMWHTLSITRSLASQYAEATHAASLAATYYIACEEEGNLIIDLDNLVEYVGHLTKAKISQLEINPMMQVFDDLIAELTKFNRTGRYDHYVRRLKTEMAKAKERP